MNTFNAKIKLAINFLVLQFETVFSCINPMSGRKLKDFRRTLTFSKSDSNLFYQKPQFAFVFGAFEAPGDDRFVVEVSSVRMNYLNASTSH